MRIILLSICLFLTGNSYAYVFSKYSSITGYSYHIMNDSSFGYYKGFLQKCIDKKLSDKHTIFIKEIVITDSYIYDSTEKEGICYFSDSNIIMVSTKSLDLEKTFYHEVAHHIQNIYYEVWLEIKDKWLMSNKYVTEYSTVNVTEDFAEVGSYYLTDHYNKNNPKYLLFKYFMKRISG